jgi:hypothetical protein
MKLSAEEAPLGRRRLLSSAGAAALGAAGLSVAGAIRSQPAEAAGFAFNSVTPYRSIDSRTLGEPLEAGSYFQVDVWIDEFGETQIPQSAAAVAFNLTAATTVARGFLAIQPATEDDPAEFLGTSTLNWTASGAILANAGIVGLGVGWATGAGSVDVFCGGGGSTHFLIDITGYFM